MITKYFGIVSILLFSLINITQAQTWTALVTTGGNPNIARYGHTAVYDTANNRMIIFGGIDSLNNLNDVRVLTNANGLGGTPVWTQLSPTGSIPTTRQGHTAVYDDANNRMTVFGGGNIGNTFNDVWVLNNANGLGGTTAWTQLSPSGSTPTLRQGHTAIYDAANNRMTIFGGYDGNTSYFNDVWVLSHANGLGGTPSWTQLTATGSAPTTRDFSTAIYDITNNLMIIFGGNYSNVSSYLNDVWILSHANGLGGTPAWTQLTVSGSAPTTRDGHTAVYDASNNRMIIFGGFNYPPSNSMNDVWILNNANGLGGTPSWTQIIPTGSTPMKREWHTAVYDITNNRMIIFAGYYAGFLFDTWVLTNANYLTSIPKGIWELMEE